MTSGTHEEHGCPVGDVGRLGSAVPQAVCTRRHAAAEPGSALMALQACPEKFKQDLVNRPAMKFSHAVHLNYFQT